VPMTLPPAPHQGLDLIRANVPFLIDQDGVISLDEIVASKIKIARPHPIHVITAAEFFKDDLLADAKLKGWQFLILSHQSVFASAEVSHADKPGEMMFTVLRYREYAHPIADALRKAESLPEVQEEEYQLRILRAPGMSLRAVWLSRPGKDILIPIANAPKPLRANEPITPAEMKASLLPLAQVRSGMQFLE